MRTTAPTPNGVVVHPVGANSPGKQLRSLVRWAVDTRERLMRMGWSHQDVATSIMHVNRLRTWVDGHLAASRETIQRFDVELGASLRYVLPGNAQGKAKLAEYERILFNL